MHKNILVIGGTGMLSDASYELAQQSDVFTSVARTKESLNRFNQRLVNVNTEHHTLSLNWDDKESFISTLRQHINVIGVPDMVVTWLHRSAFIGELSRLFVQTEREVIIYQVLGSSVTNPGKANDIADTVADGINYHQIVLGFTVESGQSRWLRNEEISAGVIAAIKRNQQTYIVGQLEPWSLRP
ncbi:hypothetical protein [Veronia pacifica]|uniref:Short-chain dehydrogenase n=1 Tax=Veronia pacifica TaxID=1080227 RepID=A0A1C3ESG0_9GAMM|nr:hypothetical protein [Veronia pacifica]ODA36155.1 hypothetical protein A8L45_00705 [Veronia pacifica]